MAYRNDLVDCETFIITRLRRATVAETASASFVYKAVKVKAKERIAVSGIPSHSYVTSFATWDHTVLPATRHK